MKRKINVNRPEISSQEIAQRKNFDSVLKQANVGGGGGAGKPFFRKPWFLTGAVVAVVAVVATILMTKSDDKNNSDKGTIAENGQQVTDSRKLDEFYKAEEAKPCINPPVPGLNIPYVTYKVVAEKGGKLDFKTGSTITVPKNAFVDANGNPVKGEVELRYREFHDAADFFVAGIPMTYDSAGTRYQFESAGMMEMLAYQDGKPVAMAKGKSVNVELASTYSGSEYNLYKLDTNINNWSCLGKDRVTIKTEKVNAPALDAEAEVMKLPEYKALETKKEEAAVEKEKALAALPKPEAAPLEPQKAKTTGFVENLSVDYSEFPEIAAFKGVLWQVGSENKEFNLAKHKYITDEKMEWEDINIKQGPKKGENYIITLVKGLKKESIIVYPVFEGKDYEVAMKDYDEKYKKYQAALDKRVANEKRIQEEYEASVARMVAQQQAMSRKLEASMANEFKSAGNEEKVCRMFAISSFGTYNCDNPSAYPKGAMCTANLKGEKNRDLRVYDVYLVDKQKNALFSYSKNPITSFSFNPNSRNMIWTVENGVIYWFKPEQFNSIRSGEGMNVMQMNRVDQKFNTVDELKAYFAL